MTEGVGRIKSGDERAMKAEELCAVNHGKLSIAIVSWNAREFLRQCLLSIIETAPGNNSEIIVVDNASSDGSQDMVRSSFPQVRLICNRENRGFAKGVNGAIEASSGEYIFCINSDVTLRPACIQNLLSFMAENPEVGLAGPQVLDRGGQVQRSCMGSPSLWGLFCRALALDGLFVRSKLFGQWMMTYWPHDSFRYVDVVNGCFWVIRKKALDEVGLLDESFFIYGEDMDWCRRFWQAGWKIAFVPGAQAVHYGEASSSKEPTRFFVEKLKANLQYWTKHHGRTTPIYLAILGLHLSLRVMGYSVRFVLNKSLRPQSSHKIRSNCAGISWLFGIKG